MLPDVIAKRMGVLPSGSQVAHALSVLDSGAMAGLLQSHREAYEFVSISPPRPRPLMPSPLRGRLTAWSSSPVRPAPAAAPWRNCGAGWIRWTRW